MDLRFDVVVVGGGHAGVGYLSLPDWSGQTAFHTQPPC